MRFLVLVFCLFLSDLAFADRFPAALNEDFVYRSVPRLDVDGIRLLFYRFKPGGDPYFAGKVDLPPKSGTIHGHNLNGKNLTVKLWKKSIEIDSQSLKFRNAGKTQGGRHFQQSGPHWTNRSGLQRVLYEKYRDPVSGGWVALLEVSKGNVKKSFILSDSGVREQTAEERNLSIDVESSQPIQIYQKARIVKTQRMSEVNGPYESEDIEISGDSTKAMEIKSKNEQKQIARLILERWRTGQIPKPLIDGNLVGEFNGLVGQWKLDKIGILEVKPRMLVFAGMRGMVHTLLEDTPLQKSISVVGVVDISKKDPVVVAFFFGERSDSEDRRNVGIQYLVDINQDKVPELILEEELYAGIGTIVVSLDSKPPFPTRRFTTLGE